MVVPTAVPGGGALRLSSSVGFIGTSRSRRRLRGSAGRTVEVEVALFAMAVVPDVQRGAAGETADGAGGLVVVDDVDPERGAAVTGVAVVEIDGFLVIGEGCDDTASQALLRGIALVVVEHLLPGERPQFPVGESGSAQRSGSPFGLVGVGEDGDQEAFRIEGHGPGGRGRVPVAHAHRPDDLVLSHGGSPAGCR